MNGLEVTADGTGVVSHAGVALVRALADNTGLTRGLSAALASARLPIHDRGPVCRGVLGNGNSAGEPRAGRLRKGWGGSNRAEDHIKILDQAVAALPPQHRRRLMVTVDGAGASHDLIPHLDKLAARPGHQVIYSVGWELGRRERAPLAMGPEAPWQIALHSRREIP